MKKRTLVCFLIFTLCVLYTSIPNTVFGQEVSLAQQVAEKYSETLQREDIQAVLPRGLEGLKSDQIPGILGTNPAIIGTVVAARAIEFKRKTRNLSSVILADDVREMGH